MTAQRDGKRHSEPPVTIDSADAERLLRLAESLSDTDVAERLEAEVTRAKLVAPGKTPAGVVAMGSRVTFRDDSTGREQTVTLVWPGEADIAAGKASVVTPIGAALIGLREGASIHWETRSGAVRRLSVLTVQ